MYTHFDNQNWMILDFGSYVIRIENLPCSVNTTAGCQADVYLERVLIPGQTFQFRITVRDTRGDTTTVPVRLVATEARSDVETIFPHIPAIIIVPEVRIYNVFLFIEFRDKIFFSNFVFCY